MEKNSLEKIYAISALWHTLTTNNYFSIMYLFSLLTCFFNSLIKISISLFIDVVKEELRDLVLRSDLGDVKNDSVIVCNIARCDVVMASLFFSIKHSFKGKYKKGIYFCHASVSSNYTNR